MNRFGFGLRAGESLPGDGRRWLLDQIVRYDAKPATIATYPDLDAATRVLHDHRAVKAAKKAARAASPDTRVRKVKAVAGADDGDVRQLLRDAITARATAALTTDTPFVERLVQFWSNHFAINAKGKQLEALAGSFEFDAVRPHVLGTFGQLLGAVERHQAMLVFLDQAQSTGPESPAGIRINQRNADKKKGLNENLAREILELHTLGVRSGYNQADVTEFARALTGWTLSGRYKGGGKKASDVTGASRFAFDASRHEPGARTILGRTYRAGGVEQADAVLTTLATHPATAGHIATKLARHFAGDDPPAALVRKLQTAFLQSGGDLPTVYRALIEAPEAWTPRPVKFKTPWEWTISVGRALGYKAFPSDVPQFIEQLGQKVWQPGSPAGFDDLAASWAGPDAIMRRVQAAQGLASQVRQPIDARQAATAMFGNSLSAATTASIDRAESPGQAMALLLVSPEFLRR